MTQFDPLYGELLTSREVSEMTGLTLNQLRNYRLPERQHKMPFGFIRIGGTALYRKAVIDTWLEENGVAQPEYIQADIDKKVPLNNVLAMDSEKRSILNRLKTITTENATGSMGDRVTGSNGLPNAMLVIQNEGRRMLGIERGVEDFKSFGIPNNDMKAKDPEGYWKIMTWGVRKAYALSGNLEVTDEDIMSIPIGDVPPLKIK